MWKGKTMLQWFSVRLLKAKPDMRTATSNIWRRAEIPPPACHLVRPAPILKQPLPERRMNIRICIREWLKLRVMKVSMKSQNGLRHWARPSALTPTAFKRLWTASATNDSTSNSIGDYRQHAEGIGLESRSFRLYCLRVLPRNFHLNFHLFYFPIHFHA